MYSYTNCNPVIQLTSAKLLIQNQTCEILCLLTGLLQRLLQGIYTQEKNNNKLKTGANEDANSETFKKNKTEKNKKGSVQQKCKKVKTYLFSTDLLLMMNVCRSAERAQYLTVQTQICT